MKVPTKNKEKKQKLKKKPKDNSKKEQVLIVAQEFKFARLLSGNEKKTRDKVLKTLKKWLQNCFQKGYEFKEDDFIRVWKGLFYAVWMSDKPLVQEELCESIAEILDLFLPAQLEHAVLMTKAGLKVLATEWYGIDQHRMDKFLMLVRRYLRGSLRCLLRCQWSLQSCQMYSNMLMSSDGILCVKTPQYARNAMSMILHIIDCYLEELAKVSQGRIPEGSLVALLLPFSSLVCGGEAPAVCVAARRLLTALVRQSECGLQYQEATRAWQKMGCPAGGPEGLELVLSDDDRENGDADDSTDEQPPALDPRAGRVDVLLPSLPVPAAALADQLAALMTKASPKAYKRASGCLQRFEALSRNEYPLVVSETEALGPESPEPEEEPQQAAQRLRALEKTLVAQSDELALRGLKRKHRRRLLAKSRAGLSIVDEVRQVADAQAATTNGDWQVEETQPNINTKNKKVNSLNKDNELNKKKNINRKRKAQEVKLNGSDKIKKTKVIDESKLNSNSGLKGGEELDDTVNVSKNESVVNGNNNKKKGEKGKTIKDGKSSKKEKTTKHENVVKNLPQLLETKKQAKNVKISETNGALADNDATKCFHSITQDKTESVKVSKVRDKRQKVLPIGKIKNYQKQTSLSEKGAKEISRKKLMETPKKVKFVLKNNGMQGTIDYYKSVRQSPNIPFDGSKKPSKTNLKVSTPSPINPFFKKKSKTKF